MTTNFGEVAERYIRNYLRVKAVIEESADLDHKHKLDFVIAKFNTLDRFLSVGVQVTTRFNDADKMEMFLETVRKNSVVEKAAYVEIDTKVAMTDSGAEAVYIALVSFECLKIIRQNIIGIRIESDLHFEYFDIEDRIKKIRQIETEKEIRAVQEASFKMPVGRVYFYRADAGYGKIFKEGRFWFFHVSDIEDEYLIRRIVECPKDGKNRLREDIYVTFKDAGITREGVKDPQAVDIQPAKA